VVSWLSFLITILLAPSFFLLLFVSRTSMNGLLADGAGLPGLSEPGVHTAAVIGMSTWEYPQFVPILIFIQADGTDIILISLLIVMGRNLFQLLFGKSIPLEPFPVLDTTNYHHCPHGQNQQSYNPSERNEVIAQGEAIVWNQKHPSPLFVDKEGTQVLRASLSNKHRRDPDLLLNFLTIPHHVQ
jgi:hypothetical protein